MKFQKTKFLFLLLPVWLCAPKTGIGSEPDTLRIFTGPLEIDPSDNTRRLAIFLDDPNDHNIVAMAAEILFSSNLMQGPRISTEESMSEDWIHVAHVFPSRSNIDTIRIAMVSRKPLRGDGTLLYVNFESSNEMVAEIPMTIAELQLLGQNEATVLIIDKGRHDALQGKNTSSVPTEFDLEQNYPNPFNAGTKIRFRLPLATDVKITIFNMLGQVVAIPVDGKLNAGNHEITWLGMNQNEEPVASGIYVYKIETTDFVKTRKMLLIR